MKSDHLSLSLSHDAHRQDCLLAQVNIDKVLVNSLYQHRLYAHQAEARTHGFAKGTTPISYLEKTIKTPILEDLKEFFLKHLVLGFLYRELQNNNIVIAGHPRLTSINMEPDQDACFLFAMTHIKHTLKTDWKTFSFKAPMRKNYKDLDRQADLFIKEETERANEKTPSTVSWEDWIAFNVSLLDNNHTPLLGSSYGMLWLKIGNEEVDKDAHHLFLHKKVGDTYTTHNDLLRSYFTSCSDMLYNFGITITDRVPHALFNFEEMKQFFNLKGAKDLHQKIIEVLSYRNDLSQRRETAEAALRLLIKHHPISLPLEIINRQEESIIRKMQSNPDYYVYRAKNDFRTKVRLLAEKQLKEECIIDSLASNEHIIATTADIRAYLNLLQRPRTKEFIYFEPPISRTNGQEIPLSHDLLVRHCTREKTLNYVIRHLTHKHI